MRDLDLLAAFCIERGPDGGAYRISHRGHTMLVVASHGMGWDHVSVSLRNRCPKWHEMEYVKRLFFKEDETAMQLHVPPAQHINCHPHCLHLWRPQNAAIPLPDPIMVAP
jgi:hypothetical protein